MFCLFILQHKLDKMSLLQAGLRVESLFNPFPWSSVSGLPTTLRSEKLLELFLNFYLSVSFPRFPIMFAACLPLVALPSALHVPFALSPHFFPPPALSSLSSASPLPPPSSLHVSPSLSVSSFPSLIKPEMSPCPVSLHHISFQVMFVHLC